MFGSPGTGEVVTSSVVTGDVGIISVALGEIFSVADGAAEFSADALGETIASLALGTSVSEALGAGEPSSSAYTGNNIDASVWRIFFREIAGTSDDNSRIFSVVDGLAPCVAAGVAEISCDADGAAAFSPPFKGGGVGEVVTSSVAAGETLGEIICDGEIFSVLVVGLFALVGSPIGTLAEVGNGAGAFPFLRMPSTNVIFACVNVSFGRPNVSQPISPDPEIFAEFESLKSKIEPSGFTSGALSALGCADPSELAQFVPA